MAETFYRVTVNRHIFFKRYRTTERTGCGVGYFKGLCILRQTDAVQVRTGGLHLNGRCCVVIVGFVSFYGCSASASVRIELHVGLVACVGRCIHIDEVVDIIGIVNTRNKAVAILDLVLGNVGVSRLSFNPRGFFTTPGSFQITIRIVTITIC